MSFDKQYKNRKDRRRAYYKSGKFDRSCRTGGSCPWCIGNRTHSAEISMRASDDQLREFKNG